MAARGARYDADRFETGQYAVGRAEVQKRLRIECGSGAITQRAADAHTSHLIALALAKADVIEYRALLAPSARESFEQARVAFGHVAAGAAAQVRSRAAR
jgi:hypothetical protein